MREGGSGLAVSDDGRTLYVTLLLTGQVSIISLDRHSIYLPLATIIPLWPDSNLAQSIILSPDGRRAYVPHTRSNTSNRALTFDTTCGIRDPWASAVGQWGTTLLGFAK